VSDSKLYTLRRPIFARKIDSGMVYRWEISKDGVDWSIKPGTFEELFVEFDVEQLQQQTISQMREILEGCFLNPLNDPLLYAARIETALEQLAAVVGLLKGETE